MPHDPGEIRYTNRTRQVLRFPTPRGGRMALAPGEFTTGDYYERFSRLVTENNDNGKRPLVKMYPDGTPVGVDALPEDEGIRAPEPVVAKPPTTTPAAPPPPSGCETACEAACEFPTESSPTSADAINAAMDKRAEEPPLDDSGSVETVASPPPPTPAETMAKTEKSLEPGIAPPMPQASAPSPETPPVPAETEEGSDVPSPPPQIGAQATKASTQQVMEHFGLTDQQVLEVDENWIKAAMEGGEVYLSRLELGWKTEHLPAMKRHVTALSGSSGSE